MSPLINNILIANNWNTVISPFSIKIEVYEEFPHFNESTDVQVISNHLQRLNDYFERSTGDISLYIYNYFLSKNIPYNLICSQGFDWKTFCDEIHNELEHVSAPGPYCASCLKQYKHPEYHKVKKVIESEKVEKSLQKAFPNEGI